MSIFYGSEIEIWAGFGPVGNIEKNFGADYEELLRLFQWQKKIMHIFKYCSIRTKKLHKGKSIKDVRFSKTFAYFISIAIG